jgi:hypothetical protein
MPAEQGAYPQIAKIAEIVPIIVAPGDKARKIDSLIGRTPLAGFVDSPWCCSTFHVKSVMVWRSSAPPPSRRHRTLPPCARRDKGDRRLMPAVVT